MDKDFIMITKEDGSQEQMEVVATFKLEESNKNCLIYKSINNEYFAASYNENLDYTDLNTDFSEEEQKQLNTILESILKGEE